MKWLHMTLALAAFGGAAQVSACGTSTSPEEAGEEVAEAQQALGYIGEGCLSNGLGGYYCITGSCCTVPPYSLHICKDLTNDTNNCGSCGHACTPGAHQHASCVSGTCLYGCDAGWGDCAPFPLGCETDITTTSHCGNCETVCTPPEHAQATCTGSACDFTCLTGWGDCDSNPANGCEANLSTTSNCGSCGNACNTGAGEICSGGQCECPSGETACSGVCVDTQTDTSNCGSCGNSCNGTNEICSAGQCVPMPCTYSWQCGSGSYCVSGSCAVWATCGTGGSCPAHSQCCQATGLCVPEGVDGCNCFGGCDNATAGCCVNVDGTVSTGAKVDCENGGHHWLACMP